MKKSTQKVLMALGIIMIFGLSSIAFVFTGFGTQTGNEQLKPLDTFVVDGEIDPRLESAYIQNGFTFLKLYYNDSIDNNLLSFVGQAPQYFTTPTGQTQLIVVKIRSPIITYARILNINGAVDLSEPTPDNIFESLCSTLIAPPAECVANRINPSG